MTSLQAKQVYAHLLLTSAFYRIARVDEEAGKLILRARGDVAVEMGLDLFLDATAISCSVDYFGRVA